MKNKKLIIVCNSWGFDEVGGSYKIATELAIFCAQRGWEVHYICGGKSIETRSACVESGVNVWKYSRPPASKQHDNFRNLYVHLSESARLTKSVLKKIGQGSQVILNGHSPLQYAAALQACGQNPGVKKIASLHSPFTEEYLADRGSSPTGLRGRLVLKTVAWIERFIYRRSDVVQCDSDFTRTTVEKNFPIETRSKLTVCPGFVDFSSSGVESISREAARQKLGNPEWRGRGKVFFCLRRHVERMGIDNLIEAAAKLAKNSALSQELSFRLLIGGEGPLTPRFQTMVRDLGLQDLVYFTGRISEEELPWCYRAADCFVMPSRALECFGLPILESFAVGTPVIATPVGAIPEVLGPFAAASLAESPSPEHLYEAMLRFLTQPSSPSEEELRRYALEYEKNKILSRLENILLGKLTLT